MALFVPQELLALESLALCKMVADTSAGAAADDPSDTEDVLVFLSLAVGLQVVFSAIDSEYASNVSSSSKTDANN
jgi:hypothetical protein